MRKVQRKVPHSPPTITIRKVISKQTNRFDLLSNAKSSSTHNSVRSFKYLTKKETHQTNFFPTNQFTNLFRRIHLIVTCYLLLLLLFYFSVKTGSLMTQLLLHKLPRNPARKSEGGEVLPTNFTRVKF